MIRPITPQDTDGVLRIWLDASLQAHDFIPAAYWYSRLEDMRTHYLPLAETIVFADDDTGAPLGFFSYIDSFLAGLFVAPAAQGRGIGRRLLGLMLRMHPDTDVTVYARNTRAVRFYARAGFVVRGVRCEEATQCKEYVMLHDATLATGLASVLGGRRRR